MPEPENKENAASTGTVPPDAKSTAAESGADLAAQLAAAKAESAANYDRFLRTAADLENFRRRALREKDELRTSATGRVLEDIFPVLDTLAMAAAAARQPGAELKGVADGVDMVLAQMKSALANHGLKEINPTAQAFDPHQHQAISHQPSPSVKEEYVLQVVRVGYSLNGRLLRPASVIVSSGPAKEAAASK
jgi:molecular chaperone GrpE